MSQRVTVGEPTPAQGSLPSTAGRRDRYPIPSIRGNASSRFGRVLVLTFLIWAVGWPFFTLAFVNRYDSPGTAWIEGMRERKELSLNRASLSGKARLLVVGGSGSLFGVDAELIQDKLGVPTVNLGTHAGLGAYIFYQARSYLRQGDSVLLCPEYELWCEPAGDISDVQWSYVTTYDKRYLWSLGFAKAIKILYSEPANNYVDALSGWRAWGIRRYRPMPAGYNLATMDEQGDLRLDVRHKSFPLLGEYPFARLDTDRCRAQPIRDFATWAHEHDVRVFYSWPNCCVPDPSPGQADSVPPVSVLSFLKELGIIVLNTPSETAFPRQMFTDSVYHADGGCRRIRTEDLVRKLRPYYGVAEPSEETRGIFLVGGGVNRPRPGNLFAKHPYVRVKYLSAKRLNHPDALTPADLPGIAAGGIPIWFDDSTIEPLLSKDDWDLQEVDRDRNSLVGWFKKYDRHLFVLGFAGGKMPPVGGDWPADVRQAFGEPGLAVAIVGTGSWRHVRRLVTGPASVLIRTDLNALAGTNVPNLSITAGASAGEGKPWSRIRLDDRLYVEGDVGEISVAVIDPDDGVMVDSATFEGGQEKTLWSLRRLVSRQSDATTKSAASESAGPVRAD
jgi:hypothetical protein